MTGPHFKRVEQKLESLKGKVERIKQRQGWGTLLTDILKDEDDKERCDQVVDALNVAAGWVADSPDKQDPFKYLKQTHDKKLK